MLKAATIRGRDVLDEPIDLVAGDEIDDVRLTVTDRISELSGRVLDAADRPIRDRWVVIFAADKKYWWPGSRRIRAVRPEPGRPVRGAGPAARQLSRRRGVRCDDRVRIDREVAVAGAVRHSRHAGRRRKERAGSEIQSGVERPRVSFCGQIWALREREPQNETRGRS